MIDPRICKNPVILIRMRKNDGAYLYSGEECLRLVEIYLNRAKKIWSEEMERKATARHEPAFGKPTGRGKLFWTDSE
jgi:hypothetical protein